VREVICKSCYMDKRPDLEFHINNELGRCSVCDQPFVRVIEFDRTMSLQHKLDKRKSLEITLKSDQDELADLERKKDDIEDDIMYVEKDIWTTKSQLAQLNESIKAIEALELAEVSK